MIILSLHVLVASILVISSARVVTAALGHYATRMYETMLITFGFTFVSGVALIFVGASLGRICATMSVATVGVVVIRQYYRARVAASSL